MSLLPGLCTSLHEQQAYLAAHSCGFPTDPLKKLLTSGKRMKWRCLIVMCRHCSAQIIRTLRSNRLLRCRRLPGLFMSSTRNACCKVSCKTIRCQSAKISSKSWNTYLWRMWRTQYSIYSCIASDSHRTEP